MPQTTRPSVDVTVTGWTPTPASPTTIFDKLDEATLDKSDFAQSGPAPDGSEPLEVKMSALDDPLSSDNHRFSYTLSKNASGGAVIDMQVDLVEGVTIIATWNHTALTSEATTFTQTLTTMQADAIGDYANLRLRFTPTQTA